MKRKGLLILAGIVLCVLILAGFSGAVHPAQAELGTGKLSVGGVDLVQAPNQTVAGGNGTATLTYENGKPVLTLENYTCSGAGINYTGSEDLKNLLEFLASQEEYLVEMNYWDYTKIIGY